MIARRPFGRNFAWVVVAVTFVALLAAAGLRAAPGVLMTPLHQAFGWERDQISLAAAVGIFLYGLVMGMLSASTATGALVFLPLMAALVEHGGWRPVVVTVSLACAALVPVVLLLMPERPSDIGLRPYGATQDVAATPPSRAVDSVRLAFSALFRAARTPSFWLLFGTFFVCGLTTNGLVGTHLISFCGDMGLPIVAAAGLLAVMGVFDLVGTTASGWLTDRFDPRKLLVIYYGLRGLSLIALPFTGFDVPLGVRGVLRPRLDRHRAADAEAGQRELRGA